MVQDQDMSFVFFPSFGVCWTFVWYQFILYKYRLSLHLFSVDYHFHFHSEMSASWQDVASKIMTFSQQGPRTVCILSANGAISNVTLRQPATSGGLVTYEVLCCTVLVLMEIMMF